MAFRPALTRTTTRLPLPFLLRHSYRPYTSSSQSQPQELSSMSPAESHIASILSTHSTLTPTTSLLVRDVSGGCGSMYAIDIQSPKFRGLSLLKQQRLVTKALGGLVAEWHGVQIRTSVSPDDDGGSGEA